MNNQNNKYLLLIQKTLSAPNLYLFAMLAMLISTIVMPPFRNTYDAYFLLNISFYAKLLLIASVILMNFISNYKIISNLKFIAALSAASFFSIIIFVKHEDISFIHISDHVQNYLIASILYMLPIAVFPYQLSKLKFSIAYMLLTFFVVNQSSGMNYTESNIVGIAVFTFVALTAGITYEINNRFFDWVLKARNSLYSKFRK